jgi:hypothetical protein
MCFVDCSRALSAQIFLITNGFRVTRCENSFSYWLTRINVVKKSAKILLCSHSQSSKELTADLKQYQCSSRIFYVGKHKRVQCPLKHFRFLNFIANFRERIKIWKHIYRAHHLLIKAYPVVPVSLSGRSNLARQSPSKFSQFWQEWSLLYRSNPRGVRSAQYTGSHANTQYTTAVNTMFMQDQNQYLKQCKKQHLGG